MRSGVGVSDLHFPRSGCGQPATRVVVMVFTITTVVVICRVDHHQEGGRDTVDRDGVSKLGKAEGVGGIARYGARKPARRSCRLT